MMRNVSTMNGSSWTASLFFHESTTELDASSSSLRKFNHDGHFLDPGNLGRWNMQHEAIRCHSLPLSSSNEPSRTVLLETRSGMMHILELPPSLSRPRPLAFKNIHPPLKPQRKMSISYLEEEGVTHHDIAPPPCNPKRILSLLDCVEVQAESSQTRSNQPEDTSDSPQSMPNRMVSLTGYDDISVARWCAHRPSLCSSPGNFFSDGATNPPRIPCRRGSIMMDTT